MQHRAMRYTGSWRKGLRDAALWIRLAIILVAGFIGALYLMPVLEEVGTLGPPGSHRGYSAPSLFPLALITLAPAVASLIFAVLQIMTARASLSLDAAGIDLNGIDPMFGSFFRARRQIPWTEICFVNPTETGVFIATKDGIVAIADVYTSDPRSIAVEVALRAAVPTPSPRKTAFWSEEDHVRRLADEQAARFGEGQRFLNLGVKVHRRREIWVALIIATLYAGFLGAAVYLLETRPPMTPEVDSLKRVFELLLVVLLAVTLPALALSRGRSVDSFTLITPEVTMIGGLVLRTDSIVETTEGMDNGKKTLRMYLRDGHSFSVSHELKSHIRRFAGLREEEFPGYVSEDEAGRILGRPVWRVPWKTRRVPRIRKGVEIFYWRGALEQLAIGTSDGTRFRFTGVPIEDPPGYISVEATAKILRLPVWRVWWMCRNLPELKMGSASLIPRSIVEHLAAVTRTQDRKA